MVKLFVGIVIIASLTTACQPPLKEDDDLLLNMMKRENEKFQYFLDHRDSLEIQIIYTQINRDANNRPKFRSFYFNLDSNCYFYPASTVKFPVVLMALEKMRSLNIPGLDRFTPMFHDSLYSGQKSAYEDTTSISCYPSIGQYIKKILVVSDNDAHNRLYEFMGQKAVNEIMEKKGYTMKLVQRLDRPRTDDENRHTEEVCFKWNDSTIYDQSMQEADSIPVKGKTYKGIGYMSHDTLFMSPMDFSGKNFYPLSSQQRVLRSFLFPESVSERERFKISSDDRRFVLRYMSQLPTETHSPDYASDTSYYPAFVKYFMFGNDHEEIPKNIRIFNKVGNAYGYLIDNAYIVDFEKNVEFLLTAVIATNADQIYNDGKYEYDKLGYPFMKDLGQAVYKYELKRKRINVPNLEEFRIRYDEE